MKNRFFILGAFCVLLAFASCTGTPVVFDDRVPLEQSARIYFYPGVEITSFNRTPVPTKGYIFGELGYYSSWRTAILPAGEMVFICSIEHVEYGSSFGRPVNRVFVEENQTFRYTFPPGEYYIIYTPRGGADENLRGVNIFRGRSSGFIAGPEHKDFIAFVPFEGQRTGSLILQ
jgi:hypothetical protein